MSKNKIVNNENDDLPIFKTSPMSETKPVTANELMKKVAVATGDVGKMKKVFTPEQIKEIMSKRQAGIKVSDEEGMALSRQTRLNKRWVTERQVGEYGKIFVYPSYTDTNGKIWYKMVDFSALYFHYHLADRMGVTANIFVDEDKYLQRRYTASIADIDRVALQFIELNVGTVEEAANGIYVFNLKEPSNTEEYSAMVLTEENKRERVRNIFRPKAMSAEAYKTLLDTIRLFEPKIRHLENRFFTLFGTEMMKNFEEMLAVYYLYSDGLMEKKETGISLISLVDRQKAILAILEEADVWKDMTAPTMLGEKLVDLRQQITKAFKIKIGKETKENAEP